MIIRILPLLLVLFLPVYFMIAKIAPAAASSSFELKPLYDGDRQIKNTLNKAKQEKQFAQQKIRFYQSALREVDNNLSTLENLIKK